MKQLFIFLLCCLSITAEAQFSRYIVRLRNKGSNPFSLSNPNAYLSDRAIARRSRFSIALDSSDLPVSPSYIAQIAAIPQVTVLATSKWLNAVAIRTTSSAAITAINNLPFVQSCEGVAARVMTDDIFEYESSHLPSRRPQRVEGNFFDYGSAAYNEIHLHQGEFLHNIGLRGQGMQIAMLDAGFFSYTSLKAFDSVNANHQVLSTWDVVSGNSSVVEDDSHGMMCFSTIAANIPGQFVGKAPKASFHLIRTEDVSSEYVIEEFNWVVGAERADSLGADVISSSLGYTTFDASAFDHPYSDRDGNTAMSTIGADLAAKKGLLVFNSVGNITDAGSQFLAVPSDGDSVVAVGSVSSSGIVAGNSSYGPSADGRIKPDMASVGAPAVVQLTNNTIGMSAGTSFACPNLAGLGSCLWQGFPEFNNMKIIRALQQAGNIASSPDNRTGYGIPDMKKAFSMLLNDYATSSATFASCQVTLAWNTKDVGAMKFEIERKTATEINFTKVGELSPVAGTTLANHSYHFINPITNGQSGTFQYRIRQIIDTAAASFSATYIDTSAVVVTAGCFPTGTTDPGSTATHLSIQPNPVQGNSATLVVETPSAIAKLLVTVYDTRGARITSIATSKPAGKATVSVPLERFAKGKYYVYVLDNQRQLGTLEMIRL